MTWALLNGAVIADPIQLLVLSFEPLVIAEAGRKFIGEANDVPVVGDLLWPMLVQTNAPTSKLVDAHVGGHRSQIDQHVNARGVPSLAHEPPRTDQASGEALLEEFGDHGGIVTWHPVFSGTGNLMVATQDNIGEFYLQTSF